MQTQLVKKTTIIESGDFNLSAARYLEKVEINSEFEIKKLNEIIDIVKDKPENFDGSKKYFSTGNVSNDHIGDKFKLVEFNNKPSRANILPKKGDVGFAKMKNTNKVVIIDDILEGSIFSTGFCFIRAKESVFPDYLYHLIKDKRFQESKNELTSDGIMGAIRQNDILNIEIPLPPLEIQEQIVKEIEGYQQIIDGCRKVVDNYKPVIDIDSSWEVVNLEEISTKITDGTHKTPKYTKSGVPFLRVTDITKSNNSKKFISKEEHLDLIKRCNPEVGDLLYSKNGTIGVAKLVDWNYDFSIFVSLCLIKPNNQRILSSYLEVILNSDKVFRQAMSLSKSGTVTNLHLVEIKKFKIPLPSKEIQKEIVETIKQERKVIEGNRELIQIYENKINERINKVWSDN